jgi:hypothetical protein
VLGLEGEALNSTQNRAARTAVGVSVLLGTALAAGPVLTAPAHASGGDATTRSAACATGAIKVKAKADDGRLEVEGEVDVNRNGQSWSWTLRRNGTVTNKGTGTTSAPSGSFEVTRRISNAKGADVIKFTAVRPATGKSCSVTVTF